MINLTAKEVENLYVDHSELQLNKMPSESANIIQFVLFRHILKRKYNWETRDSVYWRAMFRVYNIAEFKCTCFHL